MKYIGNCDFEKYIENISANNSEDEKIKSSHSNVTTVIKNSDLNEKVFKYILVGSYKRGTNTKTLTESGKKIDVDLAVIFKKDQYKKPISVMNDLFDLLNSRYEYKGKVRRQSRSIGIELSETHIDIVPFQQVYDDLDKPLYISLKNKQNWELTNPICHIDHFNEIKKSKHNFTKYVKAFKWWKKQNKPDQCTFPPGIAIEELVNLCYIENDNLFNGFLYTIEKILHNKVYILNDPCLNSNNLLREMDSNDLNCFYDKLSITILNLKDALENEDIDTIREVLGEQFPKCEIYNKDDLDLLKEKTYGARNYSI